MSNGSKRWLFNYYKPDTTKRTNLALGFYPSVSLIEARALREEYKVLLSKYIDPKNER